MFFMMGITEGRKNLEFYQTVICDRCGSYGRYQVFVTYSVLSLFFIPCFKWNKKYFVNTSCCNTIYRLDPGIGKRIERGEQVQIQPEHLEQMSSSGRRMKRCDSCGFMTEENFAYCPKCGKPLE